MSGTTTIDVKRRGALLGLALAALLVTSLLLAARPAHASTTFTVDSDVDVTDTNIGNGVCDSDADPNDDTNTCTLRGAIQEANATPGADVINFNITRFSDGFATIKPTGLLKITDRVTIDGYSQPGASPNTLAKGTNAVLKIELDGTNAGSGASGLEINQGGSGSVVKGLVINRYGFNGVQILGSSQNRIEGNFIGTDFGGTFDLGNSNVGVDITETNSFSSNTVGGTSPAARNLISGNGGEGVGIITALGTGAGNNRVEGNLIGTKKDATTALGNSRSGMDIRISPNNTVSGNTIAFNGGDGVTITLSSTGNLLAGNSIFSNVEQGIDLDGNGVTHNDSLDTDSGPNNLQNFPVLTSAKTSKKGTIITGKLNSTPNKSFLVQFFSNASVDEGQKFIGFAPVTTDASGNVTFTFKPTQKVSKGKITATAIDTSAKNTSEFSAAKKVARKR